MKLHFPLTAFLILLLTAQVFAQEKPRAVKFDEFDDVVEKSFYSDRNELGFEQRVERFTKQLEKERGVWAYVIYYQARISYQNLGWQQNFVNRVNEIKSQIEYNERIKVKGVVVINGGYRENNSVEFWIVPENAEQLPAPTPTFDKSETFTCPTIYVGNDTAPGETKTARFSVRADNFKGIDDYTLTWRVSAGEIVSGQKTNYIEVKLNDSAAKRITAYVEVGGLPFPCPKVFSATAEINGKLHQVDSFGMLTNGDIKARMDYFMNELQNNPAAKGYIIVYGNRSEGNRDAVRRITLIQNQFAFRRFDTSRVTIMRGGFRETISTDFWISFDDTVPILTPTVDAKFVKVPVKTTKPRRRKK